MWKCMMMSVKVGHMMTPEDNEKSWDRYISGYRRFFASFVMLMALCLSGCESKGCVFNSDCASGQVCSEGECLRPCEEEDACGAGYTCAGGYCAAIDEYCGDDAGCSDGGETDSGTVMLDRGLARDSGRRLDMALPRDRGVIPRDAGRRPARDVGVAREDVGFSSPEDGGTAGGGGLQNLDGMYTVNSLVIVSTGGSLEEGDNEQKLVRLTQLNSGRYRVESYDLNGSREYMIPSVEFTAPEGPGRFQYEYQRRTPERMNCDSLETRFERGRYDVSANGYRLTGAQERRFELVGERCNASVYIVRLETVWTALP
jgi:hypothetical protein